MSKSSMLMLVVAIPLSAQSNLFDHLRTKDKITLVVPAGTCDGKVTLRKLDQITVQLTQEGTPCGQRGSRVDVSREDVQDVIDRRRASRHPDEHGASTKCAAIAMAIIGFPSATAVEEKTGSGPLALLTLLG